MFYGRQEELAQLKRLTSLKKAGLVVCKGRRRIGKSRLIEEFGKTRAHFLEIQGLAPRPNITRKEQLENFIAQMADKTGFPKVTLNNWRDAFLLLAKYAENKEVVVFLDEISWMAQGDPDFCGKLKIAWDTEFRKNTGLCLVLAGSTSAWIEENILNSTDFLGRISLVINLTELPLNICSLFWGKRGSRISTQEKLKLLSITGGVPRYLEEIDPAQSAEVNIRDLCFTSSGLLFHEFDSIFRDIFQKRAPLYREIVKYLVNGPRTFSEVCRDLRVDPNGAVSKYLMELETSGFIRKESAWSLSTAKSAAKTSKYRLADNYVRFFLKYIEPAADKIKRGIFRIGSIEELPQHESIMGLQFENLVLNNLPLITEELRILPSSILQAGGFFQKKTLRKKSCQIDLLIQTKRNLYVCEIKFRRKILFDVVNEVQQKILALKAPRHMSIRPILLYAGELERSLHHCDFFDAIIDIGKLLQYEA